MFFPFLLFAVSVAIDTNAYVLLQVRKDSNQSNIDALIHKVVPSNKAEKIAKKIANTNNGRKSRNPDYEGLDSVLVNIDTGSDVKQNRKPQGPNILKYLEKAILDYAKNNPSPIYRSDDGGVIKPEIVHFRSSNKPSVKFDVNSKSLTRALSDMLSSKTFTDSVYALTKQAAVVYRALQDEMKKKEPDY